MRLCACVSKVLIQCSRYHTKQFYTIEYEENNNVFSGFIRMVALSLPVPRRRLQFFVCPRQIEKKNVVKNQRLGGQKKNCTYQLGIVSSAPAQDHRKRHNNVRIFFR